MRRDYIMTGAIYAFLSVAFGAFGAHGLKGRIADDLLEVFQTGVHYQMFHSLGLIAVGLSTAALGDRKPLQWSARLMQAGIVLFSGSLYALSLSGIRPLGAITPVGGVCFLAAWILFAAAAARPRHTE